MLSDWQINNFKEIGCKVPTDARLVGVVGSVKNYICDLWLLQAMVNEFHVEIERIECVIAFDQSYHMRPHVEACMQRKSAAAAGSIERQVAKDAANTVFGKTVENPRKYRRFRIATNKAEMAACLKSPLVKNWVK
jgi:hypothetical protein